MIRESLLPLLAVTVCFPGLAAREIGDVVSGLREADCYEATAGYHVLMSLQDDVDYTLALVSRAAAGDTLAPCSYFTGWELATPSGPARGFSAYFDGNAYNFRADRMMEYHYDRDSIPFRARGTAAVIPGIQRQAQFAPLLPQFIAEQIEEITSGPSDNRYTFHPDTIVGGRRMQVFEGKTYVGDNVAREYFYGFSHETGMPLKLVFENNPGALAEQTVEVDYSYPPAPAGCGAITEAMLSEAYPDAFGKYRVSNYAVEKMPGQRLPGFSLPTTTGERYSRMAGDPLRAVTLVVLLDPAGSFTRPTVEAVRKAADGAPVNVDIVWAFAGSNTDAIEEAVPAIRPGEHLLMSAQPLVRDCGATSLPVVIVAGRDGTVSDVVLGYNNELATVVIQKVALASR